MTDPHPVLRALLAETVSALQARGARDEALAVLELRRGLLGFGRRTVLASRGRVWRLGVLLIAPDGALYAAGSATRAAEPRHPNFQSVSGEERRELRRLALASGYPPGQSVNFDAPRLALDAESLRGGSGPLLLDGDRLLVRWAPGQAHVPLAPYLAERVGLLGPRDEGEAVAD